MSGERSDRKTIVDLIEDWQTGFFLVLACVFVAFSATVLVGSVYSGVSPIVTFFASGLLAFVLFSYLLYGRV